jgi:hypothetical protein
MTLSRPCSRTNMRLCSGGNTHGTLQWGKHTRDSAVGETHMRLCSGGDTHATLQWGKHTCDSAVGETHMRLCSGGNTHATLQWGRHGGEMRTRPRGTISKPNLTYKGRSGEDLDCHVGCLHIDIMWNEHAHRDKPHPHIHKHHDGVNLKQSSSEVQCSSCTGIWPFVSSDLCP